MDDKLLFTHIKSYQFMIFAKGKDLNDNQIIKISIWLTYTMTT